MRCVSRAFPLVRLLPPNTPRRTRLAHAQDTAGYPYQQTVYKNFKRHFERFVVELMAMCGEDIALDDFMLDTLVQWLTALSSSSVRAFRHTCTVAGRPGHASGVFFLF